jgi:hypothetical protein
MNSQLTVERYQFQSPIISQDLLFRLQDLRTRPPFPPAPNPLQGPHAPPI